MSHCSRCGHHLSDHDNEGVCCRSHAPYGHGMCACSGYLRGDGSLAELLGQALHAAPGRDELGHFYVAAQSRHVGLMVDALLDTVMPTKSVDALELLEGWADTAPIAEHREYALRRTADGFAVQLIARWVAAGHVQDVDSGTWGYVGLTPRDAAAKAIMKAGQDGHGS